MAYLHRLKHYVGEKIEVVQGPLGDYTPGRSQRDTIFKTHLNLKDGFIHSKFQKYINVLMIISNCLTSKRIC